MNFYEILGIPIDANEASIRQAYRILARRFHPDKGAGSSTEKFRQVTEAYETLIDPGRRHGYDMSVRQQRPQAVQPYPVYAHRFRQEDPAVFGRVEQAGYSTRMRPYDADLLLEEILRFIDAGVLFRLSD